MDNKVITLHFIQIVLIMILALFFLNEVLSIFWPLFWLIVIISTIIVVKSPRKNIVVLLIGLEIFLSLIFIVSAPNIFQMNRDAYFESQYASTIVKQGIWDPTSGVGFAEDYYGYNPVLHFTFALSALTTGLTTYALSKYVYFILIRVVLVLLAFLIISTIIKKEKQHIAYLATFIFIASSGMAFITISRRFIAAIFMLLAIYAILKSKSESNAKTWNFLFYVFSLLVVIGNHTIAILLLIFLIGMWLFGIIAKAKIFKSLFRDEYLDKNYPDVLLKFIYFAVIFLSWEIFVSTVLLENDLLYTSNITQIILNGYGIKMIFTVEGANPSTFIYHLYEILIIYLYQFVFLLLGIVGFLFFARSKPENNITKDKCILSYLGLFAIIVYVLAFILMKTELDMAAYTFLWFFCIPLSIFIAYFLDKLYTKRLYKNIFIIFIILVPILFYTGYLFMGIYTPRITNRAPNEDIVLGMDIRSQTPEIFYSASWLDNQGDKNNKIFGDINVFEIYSGLFEFDVSVDEYRKKMLYNGSLDELNYLLLDDNVYFGSYEHTVHFAGIDYFVINERIFKDPNYLFGNPIDPKKAEKFDESSLIDKVYDNKEIRIYHNIHSENS